MVASVGALPNAVIGSAVSGTRRFGGDFGDPGNLRARRMPGSVAPHLLHIRLVAHHLVTRAGRYLIQMVGITLMLSLTIAVSTSVEPPNGPAILEPRDVESIVGTVARVRVLPSAGAANETSSWWCVPTSARTSRWRWHRVGS